MASIREQVMQIVLARLQSSPPLVADPTMIRREHRTVVPRDAGDAVHLIDGDDAPEPNGSGCSKPRIARFTVSVFTRGDVALAHADDIGMQIIAKLNPETDAYMEGVTLEPGSMRVDQEIADTDVTRLDIEFLIRYSTSQWKLDAVR